MADLITAPNIARPDDVYQLFIDLHEGCTDEESRKRDAKLILTLVNHIGDEDVIRKAVSLVRGAG
ncbi:MAG: DUF2783 domain-containing protein [Pseudomonadota bacterium]